MPTKKTKTKTADAKKSAPSKKTAGTTPPLKKGNIKPLKPSS
jgi:hypothetical protein